MAVNWDSESDLSRQLFDTDLYMIQSGLWSAFSLLLGYGIINTAGFLKSFNLREK